MGRLSVDHENVVTTSVVRLKSDYMGFQPNPDGRHRAGARRQYVRKVATTKHFREAQIIPVPIEDEEHVDERRKARGLAPMEEYFREMNERYKTGK